MTELNWEFFRDLPGSANTNFERLWRKIIWSHYGRYGSFRELANQPGVEFHLKLNQACELGKSGHWYGWQCRWYDLERGKPVGTNRRGKIEDAINKTKEYLPELTDWVLCTRYPLTRGDQDWFYSLNGEMQLHLWSEKALEDHLEGPGLICRQTYFGELVLTPDALEEIHKQSISQIRGRWQPETHQELKAEQIIRRNLGEIQSWSDLPLLTERLESSASELETSLSKIPPNLRSKLEGLIQASHRISGSLKQIKKSLENGDLDILRQELESFCFPKGNWNTLLGRLRSIRHRCVLGATNMLADIYGANKLCRNLKQVIEPQFIAIIAEAGYGKTHLAAQLTAITEDRSAGVLLFGKNLQAGQTMDDLAGHISIQGKRLNSFEALLAAVDSAGERSGQRLPIVIDGLNEAEDPRDWKDALASLKITVTRHPYVLLICTLRSAFAAQALPCRGFLKLKMKGFGNDTDDAIDRYFQYYRISSSQVRLPYKLLSHPLTLRMFCEVTNPKRETTVNLESIPSSLTAVFEKYIRQVADRIQELSPKSARHQDSEILGAINKIGLALWESNSRSMDENKARQLIGDSDRPWPDSIMYALQDNGILIRGTNHGSDLRDVSIVSDSLAGHIVADALLRKWIENDIIFWFKENVDTKLTGNIHRGHPLAVDMFRSLVGLLPRRRYGKHLWRLLEGPLRESALRETAWLESRYLDDETVSELAKLIDTALKGHNRIFDRICDVRAVPSHPLNVSFLDSVLRPMSISDRDRKWTEWVRGRAHEIIRDLQQMDECWGSAQSAGSEDLLHAKWIMWTLTSTVRRLRDYGTRTLYRFGCLDPQKLFKMALDSLRVNDPYVSERIMAACYGVAMSLWADPKGDQLRAALPEMADEIITQMFAPDAPHSTSHVLTRDYAGGIVALATQVTPGCISRQKLCYVSEFKHEFSPFPKADMINDSDVAEAEEAIRMDFGNYTIGRLIPDRYNYDYDNPKYSDVRRQIHWRILDLGYSPSRFRDIDIDIMRGYTPYGLPHPGKVDRYGKKYSWIAFFEMYGLHLDEGILPAGLNGDRPSDADIDPSFPEPPKIWLPPLPNLFDSTSTAPGVWCKDGPIPDYSRLLKCTNVDEYEGPWILLYGFVEQVTTTDERLIRTAIRCFFIEPSQVSNFFSKIKSVEHVGSCLPRRQVDYHTHAGEIPWSRHFGSDLRDSKGRVGPDSQEVFREFKNEAWQAGIPAEIPIHKLVWEDYISQSNRDNIIHIPSPFLCAQLRLRNHQGEWDLFDQTGRLATLYRILAGEQDTVTGQLAYLRFDLFSSYLKLRGLVPVWILWGERSFRSRSLLSFMDEIRDLPSRYCKSFTLEDICRAG